MWSLFQLWFSSPLPYTDFATETLGLPVINGNQARYVHLAFAVFLAFLAYPAFKKSPRNYIPIIDWFFALAASFSALYLYIFHEELAARSGLPITEDLVVTVVGMVLLLEAARRSLGPPLVIICVIFLFYTFAGHLPIMPEVIQHKGQSVAKVASHQWLTSEGVFGVAIGVSTSFVFLFVLFGALLEKAGAGNYFIKVAFSLLGHLKGGPAKAAVLSSAMTGLISGSSIANVVTTGTFTVPLMRRVGFTREKAGAVEVASSVNGQIMPPVMGAAAFLMVEYVGISYVEVVKHAFIPAIISYIALLYIVHLEALKANMQSLPKTVTRTFLQSMVVFGITLASIVILAGIIYYGVGWIKVAFPEIGGYVVGALLLATYIGLLFYAAQNPPLEMDNPNAPVVKLPETAPTVKTGLHYLLPIVVLVWFLMVERKSPGLSAFWATSFMVFIIITQRPILAFFRKQKEYIKEIKGGGMDLLEGLITGARNMIGIGIATAAAGIIVGSVSLTGIGQVMTELVELISGGSFILVLLFTALICLVLGMGLPTTANYIVVASLMATVIEELGRKNGLIVPLIAIHLFVFYFGIMADVTPPVGLASFAAAAVSGGDPIRTGIQAFVYSIRTVILPFLFIFNAELLLVGVDTILGGIWVFIKATIAILIFTAGLQGFFVVRSRIYESVMLILVAFTLFRPGFWVDQINPPYLSDEATRIDRIFADANVGDTLKLHLEGANAYGELAKSVAFVTIGEGAASGVARLEDFGLILRQEGGRVFVDDVLFDSQAEKERIDFDFEITAVDVPQEQMHRYWMYIPALLVFLFVVTAQRTRKRSQTVIID